MSRAADKVGEVVNISVCVVYFGILLR